MWVSVHKKMEHSPRDRKELRDQERMRLGKMESTL